MTKTTIELPDDLLAAAKAVAAQRRTTLKALVEHALQRELHYARGAVEEESGRYETNEFGYLTLKREQGRKVTARNVREIQRKLDKAEWDRGLGV